MVSTNYPVDTTDVNNLEPEILGSRDPEAKAFVGINASAGKDTTDNIHF